MGIAIDRKGLESSLPHVAGGAIAPMVTAHMGGQQPLKVTRQVLTGSWPKHQMKMIGHETETQHAHRHTPGSIVQQIEKGAVVRVVVKDLPAGIATVQDVVTKTADRGSGCAGHAGMLGVAAGVGKGKSRMSPFFTWIPKG